MSVMTAYEQLVQRIRVGHPVDTAAVMIGLLDKVIEDTRRDQAQAGTGRAGQGGGAERVTSSEWRVSATATGVDALSDEQFEALMQSFPAVLQHHTEQSKLDVVLRLEAPGAAEALQKGLNLVKDGLRAVLGREPQFEDLRVVTSELANKGAQISTGLDKRAAELGAEGN